MLVPYQLYPHTLEAHYAFQCGSGLPFYSGAAFQKGHGLGGIFKRLFRSALPFLMKGAKTVGKEALLAGTRIANDVLAGENIKVATRKRAKESGRTLAQKAVNKAQSMIGEGQRYKRKRKTQHRVISAKVKKGSPECAKSELDLFQLPPTQTVIERGQWVEYHPLANVSGDGPVEFLVAGTGEDFIDLSQTQLYVRVKIVKKDGTPLDKDSVVGPVNLLFHAMFSQVITSLNEHNVSVCSNTYPYRAMAETLLNHGHDSKTTQLGMELFYKDEAGKMNDLTGEGFVKRTNLFKLSQTVDMIGGIHDDLFHQDRMLLNLVDLKLKFIRSKPEFCLMGEGKVILEHASLFVRKVRVSPGVTLGHAKALEKTTAKYPIDRIMCKVYSIPKDSMSFVQDNVFVGAMPKRIVVMMVDNDAFNGNFAKSPFDFKHYNVNFVGVYVDGQPVPYNPLELNFSKNQYIRAYQSLFLGSGRLGQDSGVHITREEYPKGYSLFAFNLSPDLCDGDHLNLVRHSNLRLEMKFDEPLKQTVSVVVYAEFESVIEINKTRNVLFDFAN